MDLLPWIIMSKGSGFPSIIVSRKAIITRRLSVLCLVNEYLVSIESFDGVNANL